MTVRGRTRIARALTRTRALTRRRALALGTALAIGGALGACAAEPIDAGASVGGDGGAAGAGRGGSGGGGGGAAGAPERATPFPIPAAADAAQPALPDVPDVRPPLDRPRPLWITAYYAGWMEPVLPIDAIDFAALTHVAHFSWHPRPDGTLDKTANGWTAEQAQALVAAAHAAGRRALIVLGGAWSRDDFLGAIAPGNVDALVERLVHNVTRFGYDGIDLDMEPLENADAEVYGAFVRKLRQALLAVDPSLELTAAVGWNREVLRPVLDELDQINLMTYDLAGAWGGWETWHNAPLHDGGLRFQSTGERLPSIEGLVEEALDGGAPREKLGVGISFYVYVWHGANGPNQSIDGVTVEMNRPWSWMMDELYAPELARWHADVEAPYLSIGSGGSGQFVSYDDARSIAAKIAWVREQGLGGAIIWELGGAYRPDRPAGRRDELLQAVKAAAFP